MPIDQRASFSREDMGLDEREEAEVRGWLDAIDMDPGFLEIRDFIWHESPAARPAHAIGPGMSLGGFSIVREIGRGGMGIVYEARQESPRRRVAIKVLRSGTGSRSELVRFRREAELLARMNHPGISVVYEARMVRVDDDLSETTPFIAMEYVDGVTVTAHAASKQIDIRERVRLIAEACRAVQHAHAAGVVHRDLSPSNILVDRDGRVKVVDFGVARLVESDGAASLATTGDRVLGKWAYVSPEQAAGEPRLVDHRTDVFALGAVLFELLAGRPWLESSGRTIFELIRAIEREPARWTALGCAHERDLRVIVETAMQKERGRRYPTAIELGDELERWLRGEAVIARPMGKIEQARRLVSSHRALTLAVAGIVVTLATGTTVSTVMALRAQSAEARLTAGLHGVIEGLIEPLGVQRGSIEARERLAESIREGIEQIKRARPHDRRVQVAAARYEFETGRLMGYPYSPNLGRRAEAVERFRAGLAILAPSGADRLMDEGEAEIAVIATEMMGATLLMDARDSEGESALRNAVAACDRWIGLSNTPEVWMNRRGGLVVGLSQAVADRGDRAAGIAVVHEGERVLRKHAPIDPDDQAAFDYGSAWIGVGLAYHKFSLPRECIAAMDESRYFLDRFTGPGRSDSHRMLNSGDPYRYIALSQAALGHYSEAEQACNHALSLSQAVLAAIPERPDGQIGLAVLYGQRAQIRAALGDQRALADARESIELRRALLRSEPRAPLVHVATANALRVLAEVCTTLIAHDCNTDLEGRPLLPIAESSLMEAEAELSRVPKSPHIDEAAAKVSHAWMELQAVAYEIQ